MPVRQGKESPQPGNDDGGAVGGMESLGDLCNVEKSESEHSLKFGCEKSFSPTEVESDDSMDELPGWQIAGPRRARRRIAHARHQARTFQFGPKLEPSVFRQTEIEASKATVMRMINENISNVPSTGFPGRS